MKLKIFLSHAWADKERSLLKTLMNQLQNTADEVWIDKKRIDFGEKIQPKLATRHPRLRCIHRGLEPQCPGQQGREV